MYRLRAVGWAEGVPSSVRMGWRNILVIRRTLLLPTAAITSHYSSNFFNIFQ